jgi:hypothetical protein
LLYWALWGLQHMHSGQLSKSRNNKSGLVTYCLTLHLSLCLQILLSCYFTLPASSKGKRSSFHSDFFKPITFVKCWMWTVRLSVCSCASLISL